MGHRTSRKWGLWLIGENTNLDIVLNGYGQVVESEDCSGEKEGEGGGVCGAPVVPSARVAGNRIG